jgi:hypothetical protein
MEITLDCKIDYSHEEVVKRINDLDKIARERAKEMGTEVPVTNDFKYIIGVVDKSIKLIDSFLYALENHNIAVLAILTRVQIDCAIKAYALMRVSNIDEFTKKVIEEKEQVSWQIDSSKEKMRDSHLCKEMGKWLDLPVYDIYSEVCGYVHFSYFSYEDVVVNKRDNGVDDTFFFSRNNPEGKDEDFEALSLELANYFRFFGNLLINNLFDSWIKFRIKHEE